MAIDNSDVFVPDEEVVVGEEEEEFVEIPNTGIDGYIRPIIYKLEGDPEEILNLNAGNLRVDDNAYILGNVGIGTSNTGNCGILEVVGTICATDFNSTSDIRLKTNIELVSDPLEKLIQLNGVSFEWKNNQESAYGVIAQELEKVLPELVKGKETKTVNYNGIIAVLIESIKELNQKVEALTDEVRSLRMTE